MAAEDTALLEDKGKGRGKNSHIYGHNRSSGCWKNAVSRSRRKESQTEKERSALVSCCRLKQWVTTSCPLYSSLK